MKLSWGPQGDGWINNKRESWGCLYLWMQQANCGHKATATAREIILSFWVLGWGPINVHIFACLKVTNRKANSKSLCFCVCLLFLPFLGLPFERWRDIFSSFFSSSAAGGGGAAACCWFSGFVALWLCNLFFLKMNRVHRKLRE